MSLPKIKLLPRDLLVRTSKVDHADWNYRPLLGYLQRIRFRLIASLLKDRSDDSVLEIGYGSGVFFPTLLQHFETVSGIDIHDKVPEVTAALAKADIAAHLLSGDAASMAFEDDSFDCAVAVSSLEYVEAIDEACREIVRVLRPGGSLFVVTPGQSVILDTGLRIVGGEDAEDNYGDRREKLISTLQQHFRTETVRRWPAYLPGLTVYNALHLQVA